MDSVGLFTPHLREGADHSRPPCFRHVTMIVFGEVGGVSQRRRPAPQLPTRWGFARLSFHEWVLSLVSGVIVARGLICREASFEETRQLIAAAGGGTTSGAAPAPGPSNGSGERIIRLGNPLFIPDASGACGCSSGDFACLMDSNGP